MNATQEQYDALAKLHQRAMTGSEDGWEDLAIDPDYMSDDEMPVATRETLDDFRAASHEWNEASRPIELTAGIAWERVQVGRGDRHTSLTVLDCGDFRLAYRA